MISQSINQKIKTYESGILCDQPGITKHLLRDTKHSNCNDTICSGIQDLQDLQDPTNTLDTSFDTSLLFHVAVGRLHPVTCNWVECRNIVPTVNSQQVRSKCKKPLCEWATLVRIPALVYVISCLSKEADVPVFTTYTFGPSGCAYTLFAKISRATKLDQPSIVEKERERLTPAG